MLDLDIVSRRCADVARLRWGSKLCCCRGGILQPRSWRCNYTTYCLPQPRMIKIHHIHIRHIRQCAMCCLRIILWFLQHFFQSIFTGPVSLVFIVLDLSWLAVLFVFIFRCNPCNVLINECLVALCDTLNVCSLVILVKYSSCNSNRSDMMCCFLFIITVHIKDAKWCWNSHSRTPSKHQLVAWIDLAELQSCCDWPTPPCIVSTNQWTPGEGVSRRTRRLVNGERSGKGF